MIRFGMKLPEIFNQLVRGYQKVRGVEPKGLDLIKIKQEAMQKFQDMRKVLDMQGKAIDPSKPIMGGSQQGEALKSGIMKATGAGPKKVLSEDEIRKKLMNQNKKNLESMKSKLDDPEDFALGGRAGFKDGEGIMQMASNEMNERLLEKLFEDLLEQGLSPEEAEIKAREMFNEMGDMSSIPDRGAQSITLADGGRAAFKDGPIDPRRRGFMKAAVGIASMLPFGASKIIGKAAPVIAKAAEISGPALAKIVETVMSFGKTISQSGRRVKEMVTKKKHKGVEVEEDIMDGSYLIKKDGKQIYYKPGRRDEMGIEDDIIEVIEKTVTKKAGGGVARLLGE